MTEFSTPPRLFDTTGDPVVDRLVQRLGELEALGAEEQVEVYTEIHAGLVDVLRVGDPED